MSKALSLDEFMNSSTTGPRGAFLQQPKKWPIVPDTKPPVKGVNVVLHTKDSIYMLWRHGMPRIFINDKEERLVWGANYGCHESEDVLRHQSRRDDDGLRKVTPRSCGICKMIEWVYQEIAQERLDWTEEIFRFEGDKPKDTRTLHAGGITNMFGRQNLSDYAKEDMKKHGIRGDEAWMENCIAKAGYLFLVVNYDDVSAGVQIATMTSSLGDKVQTLISQRRRSLGRDEGNPQLNPFVMQWTYNEKQGIAFDKKYEALSIEKLKVTPEIMELIEDTPPDVDNVIKPFDPLVVRAALEEACLIKMPWDEFFGKGQVAAKQEKRSEPSEKEKLKSPAEKRIAEKAAANSKTKAKEEPEEEEESEESEDDEDFDCGVCDFGPIKAGTKRCPNPKCKAVFEAEEEEEEEEEEPEPPPPPRKKKGVAGGGVGTSSSTPKDVPKASGGSGKPKSKTAFPDDDNDVPFVFVSTGPTEKWWAWK